MIASIRSHRELKVFQSAMASQKRIFLLTLSFPVCEQFDLTSQIRRSSRSTAASIAEAWRKRRYPRHWISKLTDGEQEAAETQVWLEVARDCGYIANEEFEVMYDQYEKIISQLVLMQAHPQKWVIRTRP
jgi:four helix bundle protein